MQSSLRTAELCFHTPSRELSEDEPLANPTLDSVAGGVLDGYTPGFRTSVMRLALMGWAEGCWDAPFAAMLDDVNPEELQVGPLRAVVKVSRLRYARRGVGPSACCAPCWRLGAWTHWRMRRACWYVMLSC